MANTIVNTTLLDGERHRVIQVYLTSDGTEETDTVIYDFSADALAKEAGSGSIKWVRWNMDACELLLEWDGSTDFAAVSIASGDTDGEYNFSEFGGISNEATAPTGDLTLTTLDLDAGDKVWFQVCITK